jgi:hypothetical protein
MTNKLSKSTERLTPNGADTDIVLLNHTHAVGFAHYQTSRPNVKLARE